MADKTKLIALLVQVPSTLAEDFGHQLGRGFDLGFHRQCASTFFDIDFSVSVDILGLLHICVVQPRHAARHVVALMRRKPRQLAAQRILDRYGKIGLVRDGFDEELVCSLGPLLLLLLLAWQGHLPALTPVTNLNRSLPLDSAHPQDFGHDTILYPQVRRVDEFHTTKCLSVESVFGGFCVHDHTTTTLSFWTQMRRPPLHATLRCFSQ